MQLGSAEPSQTAVHKDDGPAGSSQEDTRVREHKAALLKQIEERKRLQVSTAPLFDWEWEWDPALARWYRPGMPRARATPC